MMADAHADRAAGPATNPLPIDSERRKRWLYVLPIIFVTFSLAYLDRANYGLGAAAGLAATLHITGSQSALLGSLFFLGYFAFQVPGIAYARRHSSTKLVFAALLSWGTLAALTGLIHQFWLLAIDRFLLGVAESIIFPAMLVLITGWFTRSERSRANTLLMLGNPVTVLWMSLITGYLIQSVGWQKTFIFEGLPSVLWAFVWIAVIRDKPSEAQWMSAEASAALEKQIADEQRVLAAHRQLARSARTQGCARPVRALSLLESRRLRICVVAADHHPRGREDRYRQDRTAGRRAVSPGGHPDAGNEFDLGQDAMAQVDRVAVPVSRRRCALRILPVHAAQFLRCLCCADCCRWGDVCAVWILLRAHRRGDSEDSTG